VALTELSEELAPAGGMIAAPPVVARSGRSQRWQAWVSRVGVLPFAIYTFLFLGVPTIAVCVGAFEKSIGGGFTMANINEATSGVYGRGFINSIELSIITAVVPAIFGVLLAYAVYSSKGSVLQRLVATASGVFANFGGVPLAFIFISVLGSSGLLSVWLGDIGLNPYNHGFSLYSYTGVALVYMYFQIPLMVLVVTPALAGLKPSWREASQNLGGSSLSYWRHVGVPVLLPSVLGCTMLLFGSALSAYATAYALTSTISLTPIQIGDLINGNVTANQGNVAKALALGMVLITLAVMALYVLLQRRASKWLR
jgi:putative spermidine/putrescine transport system permease protein